MLAEAIRALIAQDHPPLAQLILAQLFPPPNDLYSEHDRLEPRYHPAAAHYLAMIGHG